MNTDKPKIDAPLGSRRARYAPRLDTLVRRALNDLEQWFTEHPSAYVAVSGGKDSTVCLHLARQVNPNVRAAFFDSGLEFPQTLAYLQRIRDDWDVPIEVFPAQPSALEVMVANGTWDHAAPTNPKDHLHEACIIRPLEAAQAQLGRASVYGLRADESAARRALLSRRDGRVTKHNRDRSVWQEYCAPIWRWTFEEVYTYLARCDVPVNPLYGQLIRLGVPERRARVGLLVDGWALEQGRWALARILAPELARTVETYLPALAEMR